uniref:Uncharacterized protein n=1 Tax=Glossina pallidipes TaxID=7398 RepID=A0A1A9ZWD5_GLOPL
MQNLKTNGNLQQNLLHHNQTSNSVPDSNSDNELSDFQVSDTKCHESLNTFNTNKANLNNVLKAQKNSLRLNFINNSTTTTTTTATATLNGGKCKQFNTHHENSSHSKAISYMSHNTALLSISLEVKRFILLYNLPSEIPVLGFSCLLK